MLSGSFVAAAAERHGSAPKPASRLHGVAEGTRSSAMRRATISFSREPPIFLAKVVVFILLVPIQGLMLLHMTRRRADSSRASPIRISPSLSNVIYQLVQASIKARELLWLVQMNSYLTISS